MPTFLVIKLNTPFSSPQRSSWISMECQKNCGAFFPTVNPQLPFKCPIIMSGLQFQLCSTGTTFFREGVTYSTAIQQPCSTSCSTKASSRHLLQPGIHGNILIKEPEKDLSATVTLATLAYTRRSGINRNCFEYSHTHLTYKHCCFSPLLKTYTGGSFLATTKMKGASELK